MTKPLEVAVLGDLHGQFDASVDGPSLERFPLKLCTGDLTPNRGRERFNEALAIAEGLATCEVHTVLGNHDGPSGFTGRRFPKSYFTLESALGPFHVGGTKVEFPELDLSLVGARPLTMGGPDLIYPVPGREDWDLTRWADETSRLIEAAEQSRVLVLAHCGPTGLGDTRGDIYGCDFKPEECDWGDPDLRLALDSVKDAHPPVVAVVAGHMHHALRGGGIRESIVSEGPVLHLNAAIVPRIGERGRAIHVLRLEGLEASAELVWIPN